MGPRASARGNTKVDGKYVKDGYKLQWGRARPHAEIGRRHRARAARDLASMGPRASARGNSTSAMSPTSFEHGLQWGRARPHAEIGGRRARRTGRRGASMGPRASARGNWGNLPACDGAGHCFNGAARVRTRKSSAASKKTTSHPGFNGAARVRTRKYLRTRRH